jgi:hypothetical protein
MTEGSLDSRVSGTLLAGIAATSAALLMTEIALTRIFSVTMFYHFAFLAISVALFGLSASGVLVYLLRDRLSNASIRGLLCAGSLVHATATLLGLALLVRIRIGLDSTPDNLLRLVAIYVLAALPFLAGGAVLSLAFARLTGRINMLYGADLLGAAAGCLALVPLLNQLGAPGVVIAAASLATVAAISAALVALFIIGPLLIGKERPRRGWGPWLAYFGALGAGFMLLEVALLQRFVLLLGHPVYSLTVTLFSLLLGTGLGSLLSRRIPIDRVRTLTVRVLAAAVIAAALAALFVARVVDFAIPWPLAARMALAAGILIPIGVLLGFGLPGGMRLVNAARPEIVAWAWGMNGAFSVVGATLAVFIAMNWGFTVTLSTAAVGYLLATATLATRLVA